MNTQRQEWLNNSSPSKTVTNNDQSYRRPASAGALAGSGGAAFGQRNGAQDTLVGERLPGMDRPSNARKEARMSLKSRLKKLERLKAEEKLKAEAKLRAPNKSFRQYCRVLAFTTVDELRDSIEHHGQLSYSEIQNSPEGVARSQALDAITDAAKARANTPGFDRVSLDKAKRETSNYDSDLCRWKFIEGALVKLSPEDSAKWGRREVGRRRLIDGRDVRDFSNEDLWAVVSGSQI